jgi:ketosteroid isomerase-like protein/ankyrin repeat protein
MATGNDELVRSSFDAFLRGDWNALAEVMDPAAEWLWYEPDDWDCHDRRKVLATLFERQRQGVVTGLNAVVAVDERVFVEMTGPRLEEWGLPGGEACMVVTVRDGRIVRMQDYPNRAAALAGAGLPPEPLEAVADEELVGDEPILNPDAPLARKVTEAIRTGRAAAVEQLLREHPALARARLGDPARGQSRTLLHVVTDWPGNVPEAAAKVAALVAASADVNARFTGPHSETPLHWAASSDDIEALDALLDAGADIEADGAVIADGTPMADAVAFGQWKAARRLLERGARTNLWQAAALGLTDRVGDELAATSPPTREDLDNALWCAAHGGQHETAELLLQRGADPAWVGHDQLTAAQAAERSEAHELAAWLREQADRPSP